MKPARFLFLLLWIVNAACIDPPPMNTAADEDMSSERGPDMGSQDADSGPDERGDMPVDDPDMKDSPNSSGGGDMDEELEPDCSGVTELEPAENVSNRFLVRDACEFLLISEQKYHDTKSTLLLEDSIDVPSSWEPPEEFHATLDGQGHTIRGLRLANEVGGALGRDLFGVIHHVRFDGIESVGNEIYDGDTGGLFANMESGSKIERVIAEGVVLAPTSAEVLGGLVGGIRGDAIIRDVEIEATITSGNQDGIFGLLAAELTGEDASISNVRVRGRILLGTADETPGGEDACAGGVVGYWKLGSIDGCDVQVDIATSGVNAGGVIGKSSDSVGVLRHCIVRGKIDSVAGADHHVGGVLGDGAIMPTSGSKQGALYEHIISEVVIAGDGNAFIGRGMSSGENGYYDVRDRSVGPVVLIGNPGKDVGTEAVLAKRLTEEQAKSSSMYWQWPSSRWTVRAGELPVLGQRALTARCDPMAAPFGGGDGSVANPFLICSVAQLQGIRGAEVGISGGGNSAESFCEPPTDPKHYRLASDIDLLNSNWEPIPCFGAHFDGAGYTIQNLTVDNQNGQFIGGFIDYAKSASIQHVTFEDLEVESRSGLGGVIYEARESLVRRVRVARGAVTVSHDPTTFGSSETVRYASGGVVALLVEGSVAEQLEFEGVLDVDTGTLVVGSSNGAIGGVLGFVGNARASGVDSIAMIRVANAHTNIGGVAGGLYGESSLEFAQSRVSIYAEYGQSVGGIVGRLFQTGAIRYSSFYGSINADDVIGGAVGVLAGAAGEVPIRQLKQVWVNGSVDTTNPMDSKTALAIIGRQLPNTMPDWADVLGSVSINGETATIVVGTVAGSSPADSSTWMNWNKDIWFGAPSAEWWPVLRANALASRCDSSGRFGSGGGSFIDPYLLCSPSHLEALGQVGAGEHVRMVSGISTDGPLLGELDFHFDGGGHVLSGLDINRGAYALFDKVKGEGSLRELAVDNVSVNHDNRAGVIEEVEDGALVRGLHVRGAKIICGKGRCGMIAKIKAGGVVEDVSFDGEVFSGFTLGAATESEPEPITDRLDDVGPEGLIVGELDEGVRLVGARARGTLNSSGDDAVGLVIGKMKRGASAEFIDVDAQLHAANAARVAGVAGVLLEDNAIRFCAVRGELDASGDANAVFAKYELMGMMSNATLELSHCLVALDASSNMSLELPNSDSEFEVYTTAAVYDPSKFPQGVLSEGWTGLDLELMSVRLESFFPDAEARDGWRSALWRYMPGEYPRLRL